MPSLLGMTFKNNPYLIPLQLAWFRARDVIGSGHTAVRVGLEDVNPTDCSLSRTAVCPPPSLNILLQCGIFRKFEEIKVFCASFFDKAAVQSWRLLKSATISDIFNNMSAFVGNMLLYLVTLATIRTNEIFANFLIEVYYLHRGVGQGTVCSFSRILALKVCGVVW